MADDEARTAPRVLHCHSTFAAGGKERRSVRLMNAWGSRLSHTIVSGEPGQLAAAALIDPGLAVDYPKDFPALSGRPIPGRLATLARAMQPYDLICTYNWGAMDVAMAHRAFARAYRLPPLVHHEDGFNEDESERLIPARNLYRRIALARAAALIVPSQQLETVARTLWQQPEARLHRIPNGIDTAAFAVPPAPSALAACGLAKPEGALWVGTLAGLRAVKQLPDLVAAFAALPPPWQLVICGEGPEREAILAAARDHGLADRVHLPGSVEPAAVAGLFDIFALSSASEQFPLSVVEAMAAGLPVAAPDVGDIRHILADPNRAFIAPPGDVTALSAALARLAADPALRARLGAANRARAQAEFDGAAMIARYEGVYAAAMGRAF